ncbi:MAG TPA: metallophosphoesterase family protein, partial [Burkholderiales bacterium]|nr:metallophosphoesterase family protein [Burkholderiales bacterium]
MALYGVLGDIHGNLEGLRAVLAALDARGVRELLCVGDVVGYNADADACAALLRRRGARVILGNHDLIATRRLGFERCSNNARYALARTRRTLGRDTREWLATLPERLLVDGEIALVHGGVRDVQLYMRTPQLIAG